MVTIIRFLIGSLIILPFILKQKKIELRSLTIKDYAVISYPGIINVAIAMLFLQMATYYGKVSTSAILISSNPLFVAIFATFILKEKLSFEKIIGVLFGLIGVYLVIKWEQPVEKTIINHQLGILYGIIASISFALYTVLAKRASEKYGSLIFNSFSFGAGAVTLLIISLIMGFDLSFKMNPKTVLTILYMGIFVTGLAYILYLDGLKKVSAIGGSMFFFLKPFIASLLSWLILGEKITIWQMIGIFVIIMGIYVSQTTFLTNRGVPQK
jgi:drug/metabolite transporter (DMT)-like permease